MKILGIDNGYSYTKDSDMHIFQSSYSNSQMLNGNKITINGKDYFVGGGNTICDIDKINCKENKKDATTKIKV